MSNPIGELLADVEHGAEALLLELLRAIVGSADQQEAIRAATNAVTLLANDAADAALKKL
jgi:hypothetical protein